LLVNSKIGGAVQAKLFELVTYLLRNPGEILCYKN
jgi:hypothetical protein